MEKILEGLNPQQQEAVTHGDGPLLILAGAGSGKTRVLTHRVAYLLASRRAMPWEILAVTFTNKAAGEMRDRVNALLGSGAEQVWVSTFHSTCARILRAEGNRIGLDPRFTIYDTDDQLALVKEAIKDLNLNPQNFNPRSLLVAVSQAKNRLLTPEQLAEGAKDFWEKQVVRVYQRYQELLAANHGVDFDDLIMLTVRLFQEESAVLAKYQARWRYLLIDEYQDTNHAQYALVKLLAAKNRNIAVVGDDNQSIYGFRGADITNILNFTRDYPDCRVIKLEQNYRSTQNILDAANAVIQYNVGRTEKRLWTDRGPGEEIVVYRAADEKEEARFVAQEIERLHRQEQRPYGDFALLYRTNAQSRTFEEAFLAAGIPYAIIGGLRFFERKEVKDLLAYLRVLGNPYDTVSLRRIINLPRRGIGEATLARVEEFAAGQSLSLLEAAARAEEIPGLTGKAVQALRGFAALMANLTEAAARLNVADLAELVLESTGYLREIQGEGTEEAEGRVENLREFLAMTQDFVRRGDDPTLAAFLEEISLLSEIDTFEPGEEAVTLMTLHSAKGLEFPVVFMVGMEEGIFPHSRAAWEFSELEEERRLCYVGITRAMDRLYLTYATCRTVYGGNDLRAPSRFIEEIPRELRREVSRRPGAWREEEGPGQAAAAILPGGPPPVTPSPLGTSGNGAGTPRMWRPGDKVHHPKWGLGTIVEVKGMGPDAILAVAFPQEGIKKLLAGFAPLTPVKEDG